MFDGVTIITVLNYISPVFCPLPYVGYKRRGGTFLFLLHNQRNNQILVFAVGCAIRQVGEF